MVDNGSDSGQHNFKHVEDNIDREMRTKRNRVEDIYRPNMDKRTTEQMKKDAEMQKDWLAKNKAKDCDKIIKDRKASNE